ncbi:hypothetical protein HPP92_020696 [Vanilla planifolia]|uniref:Uncharacterized protein n=1 Tax=Vanilla planifolia TaxID=51239 RepID=A0A835UIQ2_VANPL|nr:hypothetical protein HPP92_020696 [Vanilla planifolia]
MMSCFLNVEDEALSSSWKFVSIPVSFFLSYFSTSGLRFLRLSWLGFFKGDDEGLLKSIAPGRKWDGVNGLTMGKVDIELEGILLDQITILIKMGSSWGLQMAYIDATLKAKGMEALFRSNCLSRQINAAIRDANAAL